MDPMYYESEGNEKEEQYLWHRKVSEYGYSEPLIIGYHPNLIEAYLNHQLPCLKRVYDFLRKFALIPPTKYNHWNFYIDMNEERG
jgi:hypothetical protein